MDKISEVNVAQVPTRNEGIVYAVDPIRNPMSVILSLGGIIQME